MKINFFWNDKEIRVIYVDNSDTLFKVLALLPDTLAIDTETGGLDPNRDPLRLIQIGTAQNVVLIDCLKFDPKDALREFLPTKTLIAHNALFDYKFLYKYLSRDLNILCTLIMNRLVEHSRTYEDRGNSSLAYLAAKLLHSNLPKGVRVTDWMNPELTREQLEYAALDICATYQIYQKLLPYIKAFKLSDVFNLMCELQKPIAMAELRGIYFNKEAHKKLYQNWAIELYESRKALGKIIGDEYITPHKLAKYLEDTLPDEMLDLWPKTPKGKLQTDSHAFSEFSDLPEVKPITVWSKYNKLVSTYGESFTKYIKDSRIYCSFNIAGARTGRLSCQSPNMQNCIRDDEFRSLFQATDGYKLIVADYSQIEVRVAAEISKDPEMLKAYKEGLDIYIYTASKVFSVPMDKVTKHQRTLCKSLVLGLLFGLGAEGFVHYVKKGSGIVLSIEESSNLINAFRETYNVYRLWQLEQAQKSSETLTTRTKLGKLRRLDPENTYGPSMNTPIQGTAGEIMSLALIYLYGQLKNKDAYILLTVHDEIILEAKESEAEEIASILEGCMERAYLRVFPEGVTNNLVKANIGDTWAEAK